MHVLVYMKSMDTVLYLLNELRVRLRGNDIITSFVDYTAFISYIEDWGCTVDVLITEPDANNTEVLQLIEYVRSIHPHIQIVYVNTGKPVLLSAYCIPHIAVLPIPVLPDLIDCCLLECRKQLELIRGAGMMITNKNITAYLPYKQVLYAESQLRSIRIYTLIGEFSLNEKLSDFEERLDSRFIRCHQSYIVNLRYVRMYLCDPSDRNYACLELLNGERIPVSIRKQKQTRDAFENYCRNLCYQSTAFSVER